MYAARALRARCGRWSAQTRSINWSAGTGWLTSTSSATRTHRWRACPMSRRRPSRRASTWPSNRSSVAIPYSVSQADELRAYSLVRRVVERLQRHRDRVQLSADVDLVASGFDPVGIDDGVSDARTYASPTHEPVVSPHAAEV